MNILFIGDIVGKLGRKVLKEHLEDIIHEYEVDFVIANGENVTHGKGLVKEHMLELISLGIDVITLGNHAFAKKELFDYINDYDEIIRPANFHQEFPGKGSNVFKFENKTIRVTNLLGSVFMNMNVANPFDTLKNIVDSDDSDIHIVDFHAETTGEKYALGYAFDGKITALIGTHTHVATVDNRILENGTAYQSDVGMVGPNEGILGVDKEAVIKKSWTGLPSVFQVMEKGEIIFSATLLKIDDYTNKVKQIERIQKIF